MARLRRGKGIHRRIRQRTGLVILSLYSPAKPKVGEPVEAGQSSVTDEVMAKAEAAVDRLAAEYPRYAIRDITNLQHCAEKMDSDRDNCTIHFGEILRIAHDMRGQGVLFGYPLITRCAGSLCRATRLVAAHDPAILDIVQTHVAALQAILEAGVTDLEDRSALAIASGLEMLVSTRITR